jgi:hypothetical protein
MSDKENTEKIIMLEKWQPVMLVLDKRLNCSCGAAAVFIIGSVIDSEEFSIEESQCFCQSCFTKWQKDNDWGLE